VSVNLVSHTTPYAIHLSCTYYRPNVIVSQFVDSPRNKRFNDDDDDDDDDYDENDYHEIVPQRYIRGENMK
jgi:hypothetical protein